ncbi:MAG: M48 family metalloprotease [Acidobacteria bacterium]|nr:M48 family metalloprotease [Acidobacteriota bacterium]MBI3425856.1 M48 family metalloprotease [Acidobacteriota bacterium]
MWKQVFLLCLFNSLSGVALPCPQQFANVMTSACAANDKSAAKVEAKPNAKETGSKEAEAAHLPAALLDDVQAWTAAVNFWQLVERGERLSAAVEVLAVKSNALEAWVCGQTKICVSTRLLREFAPEAQQAVLAHEVGHLLIPRNYAAHPQLWEAQCDLFAVAFLRDAEQMKEMLLTLARDCATCRDNEHPAPGARVALLEHFSARTLTTVFKFDEFRLRHYAIQFKDTASTVPSGLQQQSFAIGRAANTPAYVSELKRLSFVINFEAALSGAKLTPGARR